MTIVWPKLANMKGSSHTAVFAIPRLRETRFTDQDLRLDDRAACPDELAALIKQQIQEADTIAAAAGMKRAASN